MTKYIAKEESECTKLTIPIFLSPFSCNIMNRNDNEPMVIKYRINQTRTKIKPRTYRPNIKTQSNIPIRFNNTVPRIINNTK